MLRRKQIIRLTASIIYVTKTKDGKSEKVLNTLNCHHIKKHTHTQKKTDQPNKKYPEILVGYISVSHTEKYSL